MFRFSKTRFATANPQRLRVIREKAQKSDEKFESDTLRILFAFLFVNTAYFRYRKLHSNTDEATLESNCQANQFQ